MSISTVTFSFLCPTEFSLEMERARAFRVDPKQAYYISLLEMAMQKSEPKFGPYKMTPVEIEMPQGRTIKLVESKQHLDIVWTMTSIERENQLQAIYIPLLKGLMGYRIGIIRQGEQAKFDQVNSLNAFKKIRAKYLLYP